MASIPDSFYSEAFANIYTPDQQFRFKLFFFLCVYLHFMTLKEDFLSSPNNPQHSTSFQFPIRRRSKKKDEKKCLRNILT